MSRRLLLATIVCFAVAGCTSDQVKKWGASHTPADVTTHAGSWLGSVLGSAASGNPVPAIAGTVQFAGWLFGAGSAAVAVAKSRKLKQRQQPWTDSQRAAWRAHGTATAGAQSPAPISTAVTPSPQPAAFPPPPSQLKAA